MKVWVTPHAAERYVERVKPAMAVNKASWELGRLCSVARRVERPGWLAGAAGLEEATIWLELSDGIVAAIVRPARVELLPACLTVMVRGQCSSGVRAQRNARKASARHGRRMRNRMERGRPVARQDFGSSEDS